MRLADDAGGEERLGLHTTSQEPASCHISRPMQLYRPDISNVELRIICTMCFFMFSTSSLPFSEEKHITYAKDVLESLIHIKGLGSTALPR